MTLQKFTSLHFLNCIPGATPNSTTEKSQPKAMMTLNTRAHQKPIRKGSDSLPKVQLLRMALCFFCGYIFCSSRSFYSTALSESSTPQTEMPLFAHPLIKELRAGWGNKQIPTVLYKQTNGTRTLVVDVGLDEAKEFFFAVEQGFEVVGLEPNPKSFAKAAETCRTMKEHRCVVIEKVDDIEWPLKREPGVSYLILAAAGEEKSTLPFYDRGEVGTFAAPDNWKKTHEAIMVPVLRLDQVVQEDVYLLKIDTQGYDHFVLKGAKGIFDNHVVRQVLYEVDPILAHRSGVRLTDTIGMVQQEYGMLCFPSRKDNPCKQMTDTAMAFAERYQIKKETEEMKKKFFSDCWEDMLCINTKKEYTGPALPNSVVKGATASVITTKKTITTSMNFGK